MFRAHGLPDIHSKLKLMKSDFQQKLLKEKEEKLVTMYNQQQEAALSKIRNPHYYPQYPSANKQTQTDASALSSASSHVGCRSYVASEVRTSPSALPAKKSTGIDRAFPLKPVYCRKASNRNIFSMGDRKDQQTVEYNSMLVGPPLLNYHLVMHGAQSKRWPSELKNARNPPPTATSPVQTKRSASNPRVMEKLWLEQEAQYLEEEIRRKEAVLKEKRRAEAELRWIQREREQKTVDEKKERERQKKWRMASEKEHEVILKRETMQETFQDSVVGSRGCEDCQVVKNRGSTRGCMPRRNATELYSTTTSTSPYFCEYSQHAAVEKVKKETLLASNSKIRERESSHCTKTTNNMWKLDESDNSFSSSTTTHEQPSPFKYLNAAVRRNESSSQTSGKDVMQEIVEVSSDDNNGYKDTEEFPHQDHLSSALARCSFCGRTFTGDRLQRHMNVCQKAQNSKRKVFDSSMARTKGTAMENYISRIKLHTEQEEQTKKNTWKQKHQSIKMLKQA